MVELNNHHMKSIIIVFTFFCTLFLGAQEYQFEGAINGRAATIFLHFVTATDNPNEVWSHGSFYFHDDEKINILFQYDPILPTAGMMTFNLTRNSVGPIDYIKGKIVNKNTFEGVYSANGVETPFNFKRKESRRFIVYNYYQNHASRENRHFKYFAKMIVENDRKVMKKIVDYASNGSSDLEPRPFMKSFYEESLVEFEKRQNGDWLMNYSLYPVLTDSEKVVYMIRLYHQEDNSILTNTDYMIQYDVKTGNITKR